MEEIDAMQSVAVSLEKLPPDAQQRVLAWAISKFVPGGALPIMPQVAPNGNPEQKSGKAEAKPKSAKSGKKTKTTISMDKNLNLVPSGKPSAMDFQKEKAPSNAPQKCVVAAYYLREFTEASEVTASGVYTLFKTVGWKLPTDLRNTLQQAGTKGWLDTADAENILVTHIGENLIEHELPAKGK